ncbi:MAG: metal-dependent phosphohydrolase [Bacteroidetes bacterium SW_9_63_38]|nr:MAG: metal-dependent phosphohydrolase [Bacteroidetes bacterium SW_9_63_38]
MGFFEQLGWSRRTAQPVGHELERSGRSEADDSSTWQYWLLRVGLPLLLIIITALAFPRGEVYEYTVQVGDTWRQATLEAPFDFPIYIDQAQVQAKRDTVRKTTPPYFNELSDPRQPLKANRDTLARQLDRILEAYASYRQHKTQGENAAARRDSNRYVQRRRNAVVSLSLAEWQLLTAGYMEEVEGLSASSQAGVDPPDGRIDQMLLKRALRLGTQLLNVGVMDRARDSIYTDVIIVRNQEDRVQRTVDKDNIYGLNEAYQYVEKQLQDTFQENPDYADIGFSFFRGIFQPSLQYMRAETLQERNRRARNVTSIQGGVEKGKVIVQNGERVTQEIKRKLTSLERVRNERMASSIVWKQLLGEVLFSVLSFGFFFFYLYLLRPAVWAEDRSLILITLLLSFIVALFGVAVRVPWANLYAVPIALASVLLTIVFNSRIGLFGTLILAFTGGQMLGLDLEYTLASFFAGAFGIFSVRDIKNRGQFFVSAGLVVLSYLFVLTASWLFLETPAELYGRELIFALIGASFTITAPLFLWALERTFDITTDLTLLELSDTNNQLLRDLSLRAPGSFNHSLQVANLAEAAADRIGAHSLLTRVGALYHDIGKMLKPEYFLENQRTGVNPHDQLKPRMSALIIVSHAKEGLEMGKEYNLPQRVLNFIPTHHGTSRIEYFYQKAVRQSDENDSPVLESEFRYPGPKPDSKETGILMLADSVEAASRSLDEPSHKRLKSLVDLLFQERIEDGQLDDTDLTFQDLRLIKDTFLKMLMGIYHVRIKYPDQEEEEAEDAEPTVVEVMADAPYEDVSVELDEEVWEAESSPEADQLDEAPGFRDPRKPRPELAEASPHSYAGEGEASDRPPDAPAPQALDEHDDLPDSRAEDDGEVEEDADAQRKASDED